MSYVNTSGWIKGMSGSNGNITFVQTKGGTVAREKVIPKNPKTAAQQAARQRMKSAQGAYNTLTAAQLSAWKTYAGGISRRNKRTGEMYRPNANNIFYGLAAKFLQVTPNGTVPKTPPTTQFVGDVITVTATAGGSKVSFSGSAKNAAGVTTEVLLQSLVNGQRTPKKDGYRTKGFVAFPATPTPFDVAVPSGWYAAAYRFVNTATGQVTDVVPIGVVLVN